MDEHTARPSAPDASASFAGLGEQPDLPAGRILRLDPPHHAPTVEAAAGSAAARPARRDAQVLLEASRMLQQLQDEVAAQEHREEALTQREAQLASDRQAFEAWATRIRGEFEERREALLSSESALAERLSALDDRLRDAERQRELLDQERAELEKSRAVIAEQAHGELSAQRDELLQLRQSIADDFATLQQAQTAFASEQRQAEHRMAEQLEQERLRLWTALTEEWREKQTAFEREQATWEQEKASAERELAQLRQRYDQALMGLETQLANRRAACESELAGLRQQAQAEIAALREVWEATQAAANSDHQKERVQLETRLRFQQEHLDKVRAELESAQQAFRHERQQQLQQLEEDSQQLERRRHQLQLVQQSLNEQAKSLDRERETLLKCRHAWDSSVDADRDALHSEREAWEQDRRRQQIDLQRQRELLSSHSESLERRRARLEKLRMELEDTHRTTLELRLAVEEAWGQIADAVGSEEEARLRVDQARQALVLYYHELHAAITSQREELLEQQTRFDQQRLAFQDERQALTQWLSDRDEQLRSEENRLREEAARNSTRDAEWRRTRDQWLAEKLAAESLIRRLLAELGEQSTQSESATESPAPTGSRPDSRPSGPHFSLDRLSSSVAQRS